MLSINDTKDTNIIRSMKIYLLQTLYIQEIL